jgi:hypothetical protein
MEKNATLEMTKRNLEDELERVSYDNEILFGIYDTVKLKFSFNKIFLYPLVFFWL